MMLMKNVRKQSLIIKREFKSPRFFPSYNCYATVLADVRECRVRAFSSCDMPPDFSSRMSFTLIVKRIRILFSQTPCLITSYHISCFHNNTGCRRLVIFPHCLPESAERAEHFLTIIELIYRCNSLLYLFLVFRAFCQF